MWAWQTLHMGWSYDLWVQGVCCSYQQTGLEHLVELAISPEIAGQPGNRTALVGSSPGLARLLC